MMMMMMMIIIIATSIGKFNEFSELATKTAAMTKVSIITILLSVIQFIINLGDILLLFSINIYKINYSVMIDIDI